jgi:hypothetical protein
MIHTIQKESSMGITVSHRDIYHKFFLKSKGGLRHLSTLSVGLYNPPTGGGNMLLTLFGLMVIGHKSLV